jgi:hypothetical protein
MARYRVTVPFIDDMGSVSPFIVSEYATYTKHEDALWHLNNMRDHDGLAPLSRLPKGATFAKLED